MREFKFRVWHKKERRYLGRISFLEWFEDEEDLDMKDIVVQQCTNLKDKNGKEIYEGDIIEWRFTKQSATMFIQPVVFSDGVFWATDIPLYEVTKNAEVIGNIYGDEGLING